MSSRSQSTIVMLHSMEELSTNSGLSNDSFAGLLSALTTARAENDASLASRTFIDQLEDDVATLSYERTLANHASYRGVEPSAPSLQAAPTHVPDAVNAHTRQQAVRKTASVTLRVSAVEFEQLQRRSIEAGLTVSAYLRSCTFEAESLRAQVKQALTELRNQPAAVEATEPAGPKWLNFLRRKKTH